MIQKSDGSIEVVLGGETRSLRLTIGDIETIEGRLNTGLGELLRRLLEAYRVGDIRNVLQVALERTGKPLDRDAVLELMKVEGPGSHARTCIMLLSAALGELPGGRSKNAEAVEGSANSDSPSAATLN